MDEPSGMSRPGRDSRLRLEVLLLAIVAFLSLMAAPMLWGEVYTFEDLSFFHLPLRVFYARCLDAGWSFDWCPYLLCGFDLQGEGQLGMYHPLHLFLYGALPFETAFNLELLLSYPAALLGLFLLLRRHGLPSDSSLLGALMFGLAGFSIFHYMHLNAVAVVAHFPFALLAIDQTIRADSRRGRVRGAALLAIVTGSQLLLGYPQYVLFSMIAEGSYAVMACFGVREWPKRVPVALIAKGLGLGIGAVQLLPTYAALDLSERSRPDPSYLAMMSLPPRNVALWLVPYLYPTRVYAPAEELLPGWEIGPATEPTDSRVKEYGIYNGVAVGVLGLWVLLRYRRLEHRRLLIWGIALAVGGLTLAFGDHLPTFELTSRLPGLNLFRIPARFVVLTHLGTAILSAIAVADLAGLRSRGERLGWRSLWPMVLPPLGSLAIVLAARHNPETWLGPYQASLGMQIASIALVSVCSLLVVAAARGRSLALVGLFVLIGTDLGSYGLSYLADGPRANLAELAEGHRIPAGPPGHRAAFAPDALVCDNMWMFNGKGLVDGYVGLHPSRALDYSRPVARRVASVGASVGGVPEPLAPPLPRVRLVTEARVSADPNRDLDAIDPAVVALVDRPLPLKGGVPGTALLRRDEPGRVSVVTEAPGLQLLVLSERFHPGWQVRVDGQPRRVVRAYGDFMGCLVGAGRHKVTFRYRPLSLVVGRWVTLTCSVLVLAWLVVVRVREQARRAPGAVLPAPHISGVGADQKVPASIGPSATAARFSNRM